MRTNSRKSCEAAGPEQQAARLGTGIDHAAAGVEHRALGLGHQLDRRLDRLDVGLHLRAVGLVLDILRADVGALGELHVFRNVDHDRTGTARARDMEGLVQDARQILDALHEPVVLGAGPGDADRVALLERIRADQMRRHLAGDADDRDRIHQRIDQAGHGIGSARTRGDEADADLARRACVALGRMDDALLVATQNVTDRVLLEDLVVDRQHSAAGIAEQRVDALILQGFEHHFCAGHLPCHGSSPGPAPPVSAAGLVGGVRVIKKGPLEGPLSSRARLFGGWI